MKSAHAVLQLLSHDLRVATPEQLALAIPHAERAVATLRRRGMVHTRVAPATLPEIHQPLVCWSRGRPAPDFEAVAWLAARRLETTPTRRHRVVVATKRACRWVGGAGGGWRQPLQVGHDLGVAALYFARRAADPASMKAWCGEDRYRRLRRPTRGEKTPDGVLLTPEGRVRLVVDYLTRYPPARLRSFHRFWSDRRVAYEWW